MAPTGPPAAAPTARPVTAPMSDCFEPSARSSPQAYAGHIATPPASAMPSTPARSLELNVVMLSPLVSVRNHSFRVRLPVQRARRRPWECESCTAGMIGGGTGRGEVIAYTGALAHTGIRHAASRLPAPTTAGAARRPDCAPLLHACGPPAPPR